jgi:LAO/AO transport system kinase
LALSRLLSFVARGEHLEEIRTKVETVPKTSRVVAVTGSAGVGKSTLVGKLIEHVRGTGESVGVLACDPQSPLTGGALLGDRFRMPSRPTDGGVFIRSLAAIGGQGAVAQHVGLMVDLLQAFGFKIVILETVGAGQGDTTVRELADVVILLLQPETGDDLQWEKAGVLEIADVVVIHKADMPGAESVEAQVKAALELAVARPVPVLRVSAKTGEGIDELWAHARKRSVHGAAAATDRSALLRLVQERVTARMAVLASQSMERLVSQIQNGTITRDEAVQSLCQSLFDHD